MMRDLNQAVTSSIARVRKTDAGGSLEALLSKPVQFICRTRRQLKSFLTVIVTTTPKQFLDETEAARPTTGARLLSKVIKMRPQLKHCKSTTVSACSFVSTSSCNNVPSVECGDQQNRYNVCDFAFIKSPTVH